MKQTPTSLRQLIADSPLNRLDTEVLLCFVLNVDRAFLYTHPETELTTKQAQQFFHYQQLRQQGTPIAYITGEKEFWSLSLHVSPATLIPRPETELLVELTLQHTDQQQPLSLLDLGTGSGAIAIAIAATCPNWSVTAVERSDAALLVAKKNIEKHQLNNIECLSSDWYQALSQRRFDVIVSNPPYVAENDPHLTQGDCRFEPRDALQASQTGLSDITNIINQAPDYLFNQGLLLIEHGYDQGADCVALMQQAGFVGVNDHLDYNNVSRVTLGRLK